MTSRQRNRCTLELLCPCDSYSFVIGYSTIHSRLHSRIELLTKYILLLYFSDCSIVELKFDVSIAAPKLTWTNCSNTVDNLVFTSKCLSPFVCALPFVVCLTEPDATACRTYMLLGLLLINTICSLYVTYPNWWFWSYVKRRLCNHAPYWTETSNHTTFAASNLHPTCTASEESAETDVMVSPGNLAISTSSTSVPCSSASTSEMPGKTHSD